MCRDDLVQGLLLGLRSVVSQLRPPMNIFLLLHC